MTLALREAGIAAGDELLALDGAPVRSMNDVITTANEKKPGDAVVVVVGRGGEKLTYRPLLTLPPDHPPTKP